MSRTMRMEARPLDRGQGRSMVISQSGIVASESPLASKAGAAILERGGNAVDAAIAAHAVMTVVAPMWNGIGGDLFAIVYDAKSGKYYGLNASGWAPAGQSHRAARKKGLREMPRTASNPPRFRAPSMDGRSFSTALERRNSTKSWRRRFKSPITAFP